MITIEALLLAALGFLVAGGLAIACAPFYWARAVRLTTARITSSMPVTLAEIQADRGLLMAQHAVTVHDLSTRLVELRDTSARARVEINRRDARITALAQRVAELEADLAANENARRVLERTIIDRVPDVERHLRDARSSLAARDEEIAELRNQTTRTFRALEEAMQINEQQRRDLARLTDQLELKETELAARVQDVVQVKADPRTATAAELIALRAKAREQSALIERLQGRNEEPPARGPTPVASGIDTDPGRLALEAKLKSIEGQLDDRDREIRRLRAELAAAQDQSGEPQADGRSRLPRRKGQDAARAVVLEQSLAEQEATVRRLRADLAAANERLARQAAYYMDELRRLSAPPGRATGQAARRSAAQPRRPSLSERIVEAVPDVRRIEDAGGRAADPGAVQPRRSASGPVRDDVGSDEGVAPAASVVPLPPRTGRVEAQPAAVVASGTVETPAPAVATGSAPGVASEPAAPTRGGAKTGARGLIARISDLDQG